MAFSDRFQKIHQKEGFDAKLIEKTVNEILHAAIVKRATCHGNILGRGTHYTAYIMMLIQHLIWLTLKIYIII